MGHTEAPATCRALNYAWSHIFTLNELKKLIRIDQIISTHLAFTGYPEIRVNRVVSPTPKILNASHH